MINQSKSVNLFLIYTLLKYLAVAVNYKLITLSLKCDKLLNYSFFPGDTGFDVEKFQSEEYQRTFQYLTQFAAGSNLDQFSFIYDPRVSIGEPVKALIIIIK